MSAHYSRKIRIQNLAGSHSENRVCAAHPRSHEKRNSEASRVADKDPLHRQQGRGWQGCPHREGEAGQLRRELLALLYI